MRKFGTFEGVFLPALLTIVGVIVFLRLGWIVGNIGIGQTILIIFLAHITTITTALSVSSIATNTKLGEGGIYYILSRSFGFEIGGVIGIFLYCTQVFGCALYILGFTEVWIGIFPEHSPQLISTLTLLGLFFITFMSSNLTLKVQTFIFFVLALSILCFVIGMAPEIQKAEFKFPTHLGSMSLSPDFWYYFAIFFPAVTGLESGISMSGDLKDPKRSMPIGTLAAVFVGFITYVGVAYIYSLEADYSKLDDSMYMADHSYWKPIVVAAMFTATLSSAIGTIMAAPRILASMGKDGVVPFKNFFMKKNKKGEPIYALMFSAVLMYMSMEVGDLNKIAGILTMFFLVTYFALNAGLFIEKMVDSPSFRPHFNIPWIVPFVGFVWSGIVAVLINPVMAVVTIFLAVILYFLFLRRHLQNEAGDVRYSFFNILGEWAMKMTHRYPEGKKNWKPNLLLPVDDPTLYSEKMKFVKDLVFPSGTVRLFNVFLNKNVEHRYDAVNKFWSFSQIKELIDNTSDDVLRSRLILEKGLMDLIEPFTEEHIYASYQIVESENLNDAFNVTMQIMKGLPFPPNLLYLTMSEDERKHENLRKFIRMGINNRLGILMHYIHPLYKMGKKKKICVWIRTGSPNIHLIILISNILAKNWGAKIQLVSVLRDAEEEELTDRFLNSIMDSGRMIRSTEKYVIVGDFKDILRNQEADMHIFGTITNEVDLELVRSITEISRASCIFLKDSGSESAMV